MRKEFDVMRYSSDSEKKEAMKRYKKKIDKIAPAIEPNGKDVEKILEDVPYSIAVKKLLAKLGYSLKKHFRGSILSLPDREALLARWSIVRNKKATFMNHVIDDLQEFKTIDAIKANWWKVAATHKPKLRYMQCGYSATRIKKFVYENAEAILNNDQQTLQLEREKLERELPPIDIATGDGIASDSEFLRNYINHDVLLSTGTEFIHDHFNHVIPTITNLKRLSFYEYKKSMARLLSSIKKVYERIQLAKEDRSLNSKDIDKIEYFLSLSVDIISSDEEIDVFLIDFPKETDIFEEILSNICKDPLPEYEKEDENLKNIWKRRYNEPWNPAKLKEIWFQLKGKEPCLN